MLIKIIYSQVLELTVPVAQANQQSFQFPDNAQLRDENVVLDGIESFCISDISISPNGNPLITSAVMMYSFISFSMIDLTVGAGQDVGEQIQNMPLTALHRVQSAANVPFVRDIFGFQGFKVNWAKSKINTGQAPGFGVATSFLFNVYYHRLSSSTALKGRQRR